MSCSNLIKPPITSDIHRRQLNHIKSLSKLPKAVKKGNSATSQQVFKKYAPKNQIISLGSFAVSTLSLTLPLL